MHPLSIRHLAHTAGEVWRAICWVSDFAGTLVTDCYSAYDAHGAKAKQKCLSHLARTAHDWQKLTSADSADYRFFEIGPGVGEAGLRLFIATASVPLGKRAD